MIKVEAKEIGLKPIEVNRSFSAKRKVGKLNEEIADIQLKTQKDLQDGIRDMNILQGLKQDHSEDERTLERLEAKYGTGFGSKDPDYWDMRLEAIALIIAPKVDQITVQNKTELALTEKYLEFIEDLAGINTKSKKEKFEDSDIDTDAIKEVASRLARTILNIPDDVEPTEDDRKSESVAG